jgi:hypothetical protein
LNAESIAKPEPQRTPTTTKARIVLTRGIVPFRWVRQTFIMVNATYLEETYEDERWVPILIDFASQEFSKELRERCKRGRRMMSLPVAAVCRYAACRGTARFSETVPRLRI